MSRFVRRCFVALALVCAVAGSATVTGTAHDPIDAPHPAHIHPGTCAELDPNPEYPLNEVAPVSADVAPGGVEVSETAVEVTLDDLLASPHAINVHESAENAATYIACGDILGPIVDGTLLVGLREQNVSEYTGVAVLTASDAGIDVTVYLGFGLLDLGEHTATAASTPGASPVAVSDVRVSIFDYGFDAATIEVTVGTTVTWTNDGQVIHTTTEKGKLWDSKILDTGDSYSYTFDEAGTFEYLCGLHPSMVGTVVVTEA